MLIPLARDANKARGDTQAPMSSNDAERQEPNPFDDPEHSEVWASRDIIEQGARIRIVMHHENGQWGFYSAGAGPNPRNSVRVIFDQVLQRDPEMIRLLFIENLKKGKMAMRIGQGMHERWTFPGEEKNNQSRAGCLGLVLFSVLGAAIILGTLASIRLLS